MLITNEQASTMYNDLYDWIACHTPGSRCYRSALKQYQRNVWNPVIQLINQLKNKENLSHEEIEFLILVRYTGPIFRIQNYNPRNKGYVYETEFYQSWSYDLNGVTNVPNINGEVLLIIAETDMGINLFGLLEYLLKYNLIAIKNKFKDIRDLLKYESENEVVYSIQTKNIKTVVAVSREHLNEWEKYKKDIPKEKWIRKTIN